MQRIHTGARIQGWKRIAALAGIATAVLATAPARASDASPAQQATAPGPTTEVVLRALSFLGVHYKLGGNSPETGLDCSGLVRNVFQDAVGLVLPRRAVEMSHAGEAIADTAQLKPGDLVFFRTIRRAVSHVGIYIGNNQFVHAPSRNGSVRVDRMDEKYWNRRYVVARRIPLAKGDASGAVAMQVRAGANQSQKAQRQTFALPGYLDLPPDAGGEPTPF